MPIQIGAKPESSFEDPLGLLTDCHRRIEHFLRILQTVAGQVAGGELSADQRKALETALRYFREAAPRHTADEEESLFPRLRAAGLGAALEKVEALEHEHECADIRHAKVDQLGRQWLADGRLSHANAAQLAGELWALTELYARHIAIEDTVIFPLARTALAEGEQMAVGREMAARRGLR